MSIGDVASTTAIFRKTMQDNYVARFGCVTT